MLDGVPPLPEKSTTVSFLQSPNMYCMELENVAFGISAICSLEQDLNMYCGLFIFAFGMFTYFSAASL